MITTKRNPNAKFRCRYCGFSNFKGEAAHIDYLEDEEETCWMNPNAIAVTELSASKRVAAKRAARATS